MDISITGKTSVRYKEERDCYNYKKKGHLIRQYRTSKKEGNNWKPIPSTRITGATTTTISTPETKMLAVIKHKVIWTEIVQGIRQQSERDSQDNKAHIQDMVAILRHSGGLSTEKATETVIIESNGKIMKWIKGEVVTEGIQPSGARTSNNITNQIDIQEINNTIIPDYNTIPA